MTLKPLMRAAPWPSRLVGDGPLAGLTVAVKDVIDVRGVPTGAGNPEWLSAAKPADADARCVAALAAAGAQVVAKAVTDEFAYSMQGTNAHYGTPLNPGWPDRVPGGSSSGAASAVAQGLVDVGLGTDTAGSIRVPAAYCGVFGFRPTHGVIDVAGVLPLAPSFDTVGWLTRDMATLQRVGAVLLPQGQGRGVSRLIVAADAMAACSPHARSAVTSLVEVTGMPVDIGKAGLWSAPAQIAEAYRRLSMVETWDAWGPWLSRHRPPLGTGVAQRFRAAEAVSQRGPDPWAVAFRGELRERAAGLLDDGSVLVLPATAHPAPLLTAGSDESGAVRTSILQLAGVVGLAGLPALVVPARHSSGLPFGVCFVAGRGRDHDLIATVRRFLWKNAPR